MAIILAIDKWHAYLQHRAFVIRTDHSSLRHLTEQRLHTGVQHKAFVKLMGLDYHIQYKKGSSNRAADALSRQPEIGPLMVVSSASPTWLERVHEGYVDAQATCILTDLASNP